MCRNTTLGNSIVRKLMCSAVANGALLKNKLTRNTDV